VRHLSRDVTNQTYELVTLHIWMRHGLHWRDTSQVMNIHMCIHVHVCKCIFCVIIYIHVYTCICICQNIMSHLKRSTHQRIIAHICINTPVRHGAHIYTSTCHRTHINTSTCHTRMTSHKTSWVTHVNAPCHTYIMSHI